MKLGRNDPCSCGSGKKFKSCCWKKNQPKNKLKNAKVLSSSNSLFSKAVAAQEQSESSLKDRIRSGAPKKS